MQKKYLSLMLGWSLALCSPSFSIAQENRMNELVTHARQTLGQAVQSAPFTPSSSVAAKGQIHQLVPEATLLDLSAAETQKLWQQQPQYTIMSLPVEGQAQPLELELVRQSPLTEDFRVTTSSSNGQPVPYQPGVYYRGIIKGQPNTTVALSVFSDEIIGVAATNDKGNYVLGRLDKPGNTTEYILYSDKNLDMPQQSGCAAVEPLGYTEKMRQYLEESSAKTTADKCVRVYLECDYALHQNKGGVAGATNYITAVFNNVAALYANEQITTAVSEVFVWTSADGYPTSSSLNALTAFRTARPAINGDLGHLVALGSGSLSGIAWVDALCKNSLHYAYSKITSSYNAVPTYSWTVVVLTHEMGHNLGSLHTQSCSWVGGPIDNFVPVEDGNCAPGPAPTNGGTIMSYCHLTSYGVNLNNGFGPQPGNLIRNRVNAAACLSVCGGGPVTPTYCGSKGNNSGYEYIRRVQLGTIDRLSGSNNGYADFTADATTLTPGNSHTATLTPGFPGSTYTEYWTIFIDYNRDGDFADANEKAAQVTSTGTAAVTASFVVPAGVSGSTRMRVSMKYGGYSTPCETFSYGEVEDYTVVLGSGSPAPFGTVGASLNNTVQQRSGDFSVYPNPANGEFRLHWSAASEAEAVITLTDITGRKVREEYRAGYSGEHSYVLPVNDLPAGQYFLQVRTGAQQYTEKVMIAH